MHPIQFDADYQVERNRATVFFRLLLAIPWIIVVYVWAILAMIGAVISWFAMMFTGRHPEGIYNFIAGFLRFAGRSAAWMLLLTDEWPGFSGQPDDDYPVRVDVAPRQEVYSRAKTFFKYVLYFPQALITQGVSVLLYSGNFVSWWRILFTGKQSATMHDALRVGLAYQVKSASFLLLMTETHPRLLDLPPQEYPPDAPALPEPRTGAGTANLASGTERGAGVAEPTPPAPPDA